ncbi:MAG: cytochrome c-type biogenesis protein CcmH [Chloroflexi bacterium]|nr:cytochrome c-type biogenesis protein CcmH [Chloroflexota bacterium]
MLVALAAAVAPAVALADGHDAGRIEREAQAIAKVLKCPICQNLSVADSPTPLAAQMREIVRERLAAGDSREAIIAYFVARYGEEVLLVPPRTGFSQVVWWGALAIPIAGLVTVWMVLRERRRGTGAATFASPSTPAGAPAGTPVESLTEAERQRYEALLERELERLERRSA